MVLIFVIHLNIQVEIPVKISIIPAVWRPKRCFVGEIDASVSISIINNMSNTSMNEGYGTLIRLPAMLKANWTLNNSGL